MFNIYSGRTSYMYMVNVYDITYNNKTLIAQFTKEKHWLQKLQMCSVDELFPKSTTISRQ
jgi:hypothetical protein